MSWSGFLNKCVKYIPETTDKRWFVETTVSNKKFAEETDKYYENVARFYSLTACDRLIEGHTTSTNVVQPIVLNE